MSGQTAVRPSQATAWAHSSLALAGCLWGTGFLFGKIAFREMTVAENVFFRFLFACLILVPILIGKRKTFAPRDLVWLVAAAVIGVPVQFLMQFKGLQLTTVSHASLFWPSRSLLGIPPRLPGQGFWAIFSYCCRCAPPPRRF